MLSLKSRSVCVVCVCVPLCLCLSHPSLPPSLPSLFLCLSVSPSLPSLFLCSPTTLKTNHRLPWLLWALGLAQSRVLAFSEMSSFDLTEGRSCSGGTLQQGGQNGHHTHKSLRDGQVERWDLVPLCISKCGQAHKVRTVNGQWQVPRAMAKKLDPSFSQSLQVPLELVCLPEGKTLTRRCSGGAVLAKNALDLRWNVSSCVVLGTEPSSACQAGTIPPSYILSPESRCVSLNWHHVMCTCSVDKLPQWSVGNTRILF